VSTQVPIPLSSYTDLDPRASSKQLIGCFSEALDQDSPADTKNAVNTSMTACLRRMPGMTQLPGFGDGTGNPVRGMWEMAGVQYVVIGPTLYSATIDAANNVVLTSISTAVSGGTRFVRMTDNGACLVILVPGTPIAYTYTPASASFLQLTNTFFTALGGIDCWFVDSFIVFLAINGTTFFNDDGRAVSGTGQITFTTASSFTREFGTDLFVGGIVDHREVVLFGTRTTEGYVNAGNPAGSPFSSAPDSFMQIGCHPLCGYTVCEQDQSVFWVANDKTVRRRNGQTPTIISNSGIEQVLNSINLTGSYALFPTVYGHPLYVLTCPNANGPNAGRTLVYNCRTQKWFELESYDLENSVNAWRPLCYYNGFGYQLVGDTYSDAVGILNENAFSEFANTQICEFVTQAIYDGNNRIQHRRLEIVVTAGGSPTQNTVPIIDIFESDDAGRTFTQCWDVQNLGGAGQYDQRAVIFNAGQSRQRVYKARITDPTPTFTVDIQAELEGGKW
jgi:hypothetical protein